MMTLFFKEKKLIDRYSKTHIIDHLFVILKGTDLVLENAKWKVFVLTL